MPDFPPQEFHARTRAAQAAMAVDGLDALFLTTEAEFRYFTGFRTLFWQSPTRPWFLVLPSVGAPVAIIPSIGVALMQETWISDIRAWQSPAPEDDGVSLVIEALDGFNRIGMPMGAESALRMPLADFGRLKRACGGEFVDATPLLRSLRSIKSPAEIDLIRKICSYASAAFSRAPELFYEGQSLDDAFRAFRIALLSEGVDDVPYLVGGAGQGGYGDVISPPSNLPLVAGDILMLDTGATLGGYFCDFDRNFAIGRANDDSKAAHHTLWQATQAGISTALAGRPVAALFEAMAAKLPQGTSSVGRFGHGLGMQLTEWPSVLATETTILKPGMVMTLEPSLEIASGRMMVHEENILITEGAPEVLSRRADADLPVI